MKKTYLVEQLAKKERYIGELEYRISELKLEISQNKKTEAKQTQEKINELDSAFLDGTGGPGWRMVAEESPLESRLTIFCLRREVIDLKRRVCVLESTSPTQTNGDAE